MEENVRLQKHFLQYLIMCESQSQPDRRSLVLQVKTWKTKFLKLCPLNNQKWRVAFEKSIK